MTKYDLSSIHHCCIAGGAPKPRSLQKWLDLTGLKLYEGFGQSESSVMLANFQWFEPIPGSTGKPSPLYDIQLVNAEGNSCEDGEEGTIAVMDVKNHPPTGLFTGYFQNPEMTQEKLGGAYYDTGDVAWRDSNGYYWFVGRNDAVIKCSGYRYWALRGGERPAGAPCGGGVRHHRRPGPHPRPGGEGTLR